MAQREGLQLRMMRIGVRAFQTVRRGWWFVTRPVTFGVRAIPVTPEGHVVLVRHSYLDGWHLPGGGRRRHEDARLAALRELREEIGLFGHGAVSHLTDFFHRPDFKRDTVSVFVVEEVAFRFEPSLEIVAVHAFPPDALPYDTSPGARRSIAGWLKDVRSG